MDNEEYNEEARDGTISTDELLDQCIIIDKVLLKLNLFVVVVLTLLYIGISLAAKDIKGLQIILMSVYASLALRVITGIIEIIRNIRGSRKRKKALKDGTYADVISESEEETRELLMKKAEYYSEYLEWGRRGR